VEPGVLSAEDVVSSIETLAFSLFEPPKSA
jgi:hypothetical protein